MTDKIYLKVLTGESDPIKIAKDLNLSPDRVILKNSQSKNDKGVYKYNALIFNINLTECFSEKYKELLENLGTLNIQDLELNLNIEYLQHSSGIYLNSEFLKELGGLNINIDIHS